MFNKRDLRTFSMLGIRRAFFLKLTELAAKNPDTVILSADVTRGNGLEKFQQNYPEQFYNIGIAEQNMIGIAAGMSKVGLNVFATTFSIFLTTRCLDQVRINLGYMKIPIKLVGRGGGLCLANNGPTHYAVEDFAIMRSLSNITVATPADAFEAVKLAEAAVNYDKPMYIRITGGTNCPIIYSDDYNFEAGKIITLIEGEGVGIISTGSIISESLKAAKILSEKNIPCAVYNMHTIKPIDKVGLKNIFDKHKFIVTVEEHNIIGGLGSAVAEYKATLENTPRQIFIGVPDTFAEAGSHNYVLSNLGLTADKIAERIENEWSNSNA